MKPSNEEKQNKRQRAALQHVCNKLTSNFSFKLIKTWRDVYVMVGIDTKTIAATYQNADVAITFPELKAYCAELKSTLESSIAGRVAAAGGDLPKPAPKPAPVLKTTDLIIDESAPKSTVAAPPVVSLPMETQLTNKLDEDYGLVPSPNEKAFLYWFQKKATAELLRGFGIE